MKHWLAWSLAAMMAIPAAGQSAPAAPAEAQKAPAGDAFAELREQWARNLHDKRLDALLAEYAEDGEFIDPGGSGVQGRAALRSFLETIAATYDSDLTFHSERVEVSGELAFDSGTYEEKLIYRATAKAQKSSGRYLTIYRRGSNGVWLIVEQAWTGTITEAAVLAGYSDGIKARARAMASAARAGVVSPPV